MAILAITSYMLQGCPPWVKTVGNCTLCYMQKWDYHNDFWWCVLAHWVGGNLNWIQRMSGDLVGNSQRKYFWETHDFCGEKKNGSA